MTADILTDKDQTARAMYSLVERYHQDIMRLPALGVMLGQLGINSLFDIVKKIPYKRDPANIEILMRPEIIWKRRRAGMDCKKKAILIAAWARHNLGPGSYKFVATSSAPNGRLHHVFPVVKIGNGWIILDGTYRIQKINQPKFGLTKIEELTK